MKAFGLENVKAFTDTGYIKLAPLTIFVGQNSCGKSSFIRFPVVLSQSYRESHNAICLHSQNPDTIDYGNFADVLHNHQGNKFACKFTYSYKDILMEQSGQERNAVVSKKKEKGRKDFDVNIRISYSKEDYDKHIIISDYEVYFADQLAFSIKRESKDQYLFTLQKNIDQTGRIEERNYSVPVVLYRGIEPFYRFDDRIREDIVMKELGVGFTEAQEIVDQIFTSKDTLFFQDQSLNHLFNLYPSMTEEKIKVIMDVYKFIVRTLTFKMTIDDIIKKECGLLRYIGPFRTNPERIYRRDEGDNKGVVGKNGGQTSNILINDVIDQSMIINQVSDWFEKAFGYSVIVEELGKGYYQIVLADASKKKNNIMDVGYGISQVLPIVTQIAEVSVCNIGRNEKNNTTDEIYVIEQPELHLHPGAQSQLATLFVNAISNGAADYCKILIETHSEHFIRALQVLIADPSCFLSVDMVKVYYIDKNESGESFIQEMCLNEDGQFVNEWPSGFFDKSFILSKELMHAIASRKTQGKKAER